MKKRGLHSLYAKDPVHADEAVFGRTSHHVTRRGFLSGLKSLSVLLGAEVVYGQFMPAGLELLGLLWLLRELGGLGECWGPSKAL